MNYVIGTLGYLLMVVSAVFIDTPIIAIFALPIFLAGFILVLLFYLKQIDKKKPRYKLSKKLIIAGVVVLWLLLGHTAIEYNQFQGYLGRGQNIRFGWVTIISVAAINLLSSILIFEGIGIGNNDQLAKRIANTIPTLLIIPVTIILIKIIVITGIWMGASI